MSPTSGDGGMCLLRCAACGRPIQSALYVGGRVLCRGCAESPHDPEPLSPVEASRFDPRPAACEDCGALIEVELFALHRLLRGRHGRDTSEPRWCAECVWRRLGEL